MISWIRRRIRRRRTIDLWEPGTGTDRSDDEIPVIISPGSVPLAVNLHPEVAATLRRLLDKKGLTVTEGARNMVKIWEFLEGEVDQGNTLATIAPDGTIHKIEMP